MTTSNDVVAGSTARYKPFGDYRTTPTNNDTDMGFTGHKENRDIGLTYMNARFYLPNIGRFASADTIVPDPANPQSFNRYSYVLNLPIKFTDPTGHCVFGLPCPDIVQDGINATVDFMTGAAAQYAYDNSLHLMTDLAPSSNESVSTTAGRIVGGVASTLQGSAEIVGGAGMTAGGAAACGTGVLCLAGAPAMALGGGIVLHGTAVASSGAQGLIENGGALLSEITSGGSGNSGRMHRLGYHFGKHGRDMGYGSKKEYNQAAHEFAQANQQNPAARVFEGFWNGRGKFNDQLQRAIVHDGRTVVIDVNSGQIVDFYEGSELRGLIHVQEILP